MPNPGRLFCLLLALALLLSSSTVVAAATAETETETCVEPAVGEEAIEDIITELEAPQRRAALIARLQILADAMGAPAGNAPAAEEAMSKLMRAASSQMAALSKRTLYAVNQLQQVPNQGASVLGCTALRRCCVSSGAHCSSR